MELTEVAPPPSHCLDTIAWLDEAMGSMLGRFMTLRRTASSFVGQIKREQEGGREMR